MENSQLSIADFLQNDPGGSMLAVTGVVSRSAVSAHG